MGRRRGLFAALAAANALSERQARARVRDAVRANREYERSIRRDEREEKLALRAASDAHHERRGHEVDDLNAELAERDQLLHGVLTARPHSAPYGTPDARLKPETIVARSFARLKQEFAAKPFVAEVAVGGPKPQPPDPRKFRPVVKQPGFFGRLFGGQAKYEATLRDQERSAHERLTAAEEAFQGAAAEWDRKVSAASEAHSKAESKRVAKIASHNDELAQWEHALRERNHEAVIQFITLMLDGLEYEEDFPQEFRIAYSPESLEIVLESVLPTLDVVPTIKEHSYVKAKGEIRKKLRPRAEVTADYRTIIAAFTLRTIADLFSCVPPDIASTITFNGILDTVDPTTGKAIRPCVISVRTTRDVFAGLQLDRVDATACLASLGASVSKRPEELSPIRPVIEFDMVDKRFVPSEDAIAELDARPNIMDLNPFEFENLVTNLFSKMGLDAKQTRSSRDGGVDCVAFDPRPVLGGKVVIQAKRYKNTVGVSAVRDLYGTMMNEGANKGILVTTAGYGPDAHEFAKDKPIELIDGGGLLYLLEQQGVHARIVMPV